MPKCTVTVDQNHKLVHPDSDSFVKANDLLTGGNLHTVAVEGLKLKGMDTVNNVQYQVKLSVSITKIGEGANAELIPQINLSIVEEGD